jgi:hypothetical protein
MRAGQYGAHLGLLQEREAKRLPRTRFRAKSGFLQNALGAARGKNAVSIGSEKEWPRSLPTFERRFNNGRFSLLRCSVSGRSPGAPDLRSAPCLPAPSDMR